MRGECYVKEDGTAFQSAPGREAGRCTLAPARSSTRWLFQSAPGREAGRCILPSPIALVSNQFQSAPGREAGRCRQPFALQDRARGFNPRPAVRPGDALRGSWNDALIDVSIRARP